MILLAVFSWGFLGLLIYFFSPYNPLPLPVSISLTPLPLFFLLAFLALFASFSLLLRSVRRGIIVAATLTAITLLRFFHLFEPLYLIFVVAIAITTEIIFYKMK
jgi:hypothetical protein